MATGRSKTTKTKPVKPTARAKDRTKRPRDVFDVIKRLETVFAETAPPGTASARLAEVWLRLHRTLRGIVLPQLERSGALEFESAVVGLDEWSAAALADLIDCSPSDPSYANRLIVVRTLIELQLAAELSALGDALRETEIDAGRSGVLSDALSDVAIFEAGEQPDVDAIFSALTRRAGRAAAFGRSRGMGAARRFRAVDDRDDFAGGGVLDDDVLDDRVHIPRRASDYRYEEETDLDRPIGRRHPDDERRGASRPRDYDDRRD